MITAGGPRYRQFAAFPVAIQAVIMNPAREVLLLFSPTRNQGWQLVSGALEAGETPLEGTLREVQEEVGSAIELRALGIIHAESFHYDAQVPFMLSIYTLFAYQGGSVEPGDDMTGSDYGWWALPDLKRDDLKLHATVKLWLLERAVELYDLWHNRPQAPLQPPLK